MMQHIDASDKSYFYYQHVISSDNCKLQKKLSAHEREMIL